LFLYGQVLALQALAARGVFLPTSPHGAFIYVLTGVHGVHVGAGLVVLAYTAVRLGIASGPGFPPVARLLTASATFWHFLAVLWIYVLLLITMF
jgi:cytochrome c oxidase subunit 3